MSDGMRRELAYLSSHATNRYFIPNWGILLVSTRSGRYFFTATFLLLRNLQRLSNLDVVALDAVGFFKF